METGTLSHKRTLKNLQEKHDAGVLEPNALDSTGLSLVHQFAYDGQVTCLKWLLKHGGSATARSSEGCVAAHYAAAGGHLSILHLLKEEQADSIKIKDNNDTYPLYIAAQEGQLDCIIWLAKHSGLSGSEPAKDGMTAVHAAAQEGHLDCVRYLIQLAHCSPVVADYSGCTPLHFASAEGHWKVVKWLLEYGGALGDMRDKTGSAAIHLAAEYDRISVLKILAKLNNHITLQDDAGRTAIDICQEKGHTECAQFLSQWQKQSSVQKNDATTRASLKKVRFDENEDNSTDVKQGNQPKKELKIEEDYLIIAGQLSKECLEEQLKINKEEWMKSNLGNIDDINEKDSRHDKVKAERDSRGFKAGRNVRKRSSFKDKNSKYQVKEKTINRDSLSAILAKLQKKRPRSEYTEGASFGSRTRERSHPDLIQSVMQADRNASVGFRRRPSLEFFQDLRSQVKASTDKSKITNQNQQSLNHSNQSGQLTIYQNGALRSSRDNLQDSGLAPDLQRNSNVKGKTDDSGEIASKSKEEHRTVSDWEMNIQPNVKPVIKDESSVKTKITSNEALQKPHPQKKIKKPKGFTGLLPKSNSDFNMNPKAKENPNSSKATKKSGTFSSKSNKNKSNGYSNTKRDLPPGVPEHYLIRSLPLPTHGSHRAGGNEKLSFYSYNLTNERKQAPGKWASVRQTVGSFFSSLRGNKREKVYEVSDMLGSHGSYQHRHESRKFNIAKSLPIKKRKSISLEHMPNFSSTGEHINITNTTKTGKSTVKKLSNLQPGYTEPDIYKLTSMALDHTLKGKINSPPQEVKLQSRPKPEESLDFVVANKDQTGFQLDSLQVNNKEDQVETGKALMW